MGGKKRQFTGKLAASALILAAVDCRAGSVAVLPTNDTFGYGYGTDDWSQMTAEMNSVTGSPIVDLPDLANLSQMLRYDGLWLDVQYQRPLTDAETANLRAYIATGRRVVLVGSNLNFAAWDSSILSAVGGSFNTGSGNSVRGTIPNNTAPTVLTAQVENLLAAAASNATLAPTAGIKLFDQPVATLWGPANNALVYLDAAGFSTGFSPGYYNNNKVFADNVANWIAGNLSSGPDLWANTTSGSWSTGGSWTTAFTPGSGDDAQFSTGSTGHTVTIASPVVCRNLNVSSDQVTFDLPGTGSLTAFGILTVTNSSALSLTRSGGPTATTVSVAGVNVAPGSTLTVGAGTVLLSPTTTGPVTLAGSTGQWTGTLDVTTGSADLTGTSLTTVTDQVRKGFNYAAGGNWGGTGITSSAAAADTAHLHAVGVMAGTSGDVIVRFTYFGDANLDGKVDGSDYSLIDAGFTTGGRSTGWAAGDFNYDGVVDGSDYALIDNAFNNETMATPAAVATDTAQAVAVPEPVGIGAIAIFAAAMWRRNRERRK